MKFLNWFSGDSKPPAREAPKQKQVVLKNAKRDSQLEQHATKSAERELYQYKKPQQELGMTDLIKEHQSGNRFLYAALVGRNEEEDSSRLRRLLQMSPKLNRYTSNLDNLPLLELYKEVETFALASAIRPRKGKGDSRKKYIHIREVKYMFGSLISSDSAYTKVQIALMDDRLTKDKVAKKVICNTNMMSNGIINLDYCFPENEITKMSLTISREAQFLEEDSQWGVVKVEIQYVTLDFPVQTSNSRILAVNRLVESTLEDREVDPNVIDISTNESNRQDLQDMYMSGDIADEVAPMTEKKTPVKYAKSTLAGPRGVKTSVPYSPEWDFMKDRRTAGANAGDNSVDPSEDGDIEEIPRSPSPMLYSQRARVEEDMEPESPPLKSAMRKSQDTRIAPRRVIVEDPNDSPMQSAF